MGNPLIIVGPQASGKTRNSDAFQQVLGCKRVVDNWDGRTKLKDGDLALTNVEKLPSDSGYRVLSITDALLRLNVVR